MDENYSLRELNEWADKVIDCISKWADEMNKAFNGAPTSIKIEKLDSSAHDKMFEDKIASLENQIAYMKEKKNYLRTRCMEDATDAFDSGAYGRLTIVGRRVDLEAENEKLKQRIAELESKITEKPTKINLNDRIKVKLTPLGAEIYYHQYDEVNKKIKENGGTELEPMMPQIDKDGYTEFQLHHFISLYGEHIGMCKPNVIEPLDIVIVEYPPNALQGLNRHLKMRSGKMYGWKEKMRIWAK